MPNPNAVVSTVIRLDPPLDRPPDELVEEGLSVELEGDTRVRLDPADRRSTGFAQVLDGLSRHGMPVYLEIDPATSGITRLLIPHVTRVLDVRPVEGGLEIELERSHARHVLRRGAPDFDELDDALRKALDDDAPVIVTEDDDHRILDVRSFTPGPEGPPRPFPRPPRPRPLPWFQRWIRAWFRLWRWWWLRLRLRCVSAAKAQDVFDAMNATSCPPLTVPAPCIPFLYPDNGCWARAHEMSRLMIAMGLNPRKVWIQGVLHAPTKNHPSCAVNWAWHVAPILCVRLFGFWATDMVIDPSLAAGPVTKSAWKGLQGDPAATLTETDASDYYWGSTDPNYVDTNADLVTYRLQLQTRAIQQGPPPYANCP